MAHGALPRPPKGDPGYANSIENSALGYLKRNVVVEIVAPAAAGAFSGVRIFRVRLPATPAPGPAGGSSSDLQQLKTMALGLAATLTTMRERIEQLAAGQEQTASDIAKLQAAEQEIRHKISAIATRPAAAAPSKPTTTAPSRAPMPPR